MNNKIIYIIFMFFLSLLILSCTNTTNVQSSSASTIKESKQVATASTPKKEIQQSMSTKKVINIEKGSVARYVVREQLVRWVSEKDVSGKTELVDGRIIISPEGKLIAKGSSFVVNVKSLKSDESKRDNYIKNNALESNKFPEAIFEINSMEGLKGPLPTNGLININLTGNMTIHGVTKEITWKLVANVENDNIEGIAKTEIDFNTFNIKKPSLPFILTIDDTLKLELDFIAKVQSD